jgi:hypothetical protein
LLRRAWVSAFQRVVRAEGLQKVAGAAEWQNAEGIDSRVAERSRGRSVAGDSR